MIPMIRNRKGRPVLDAGAVTILALVMTLLLAPLPSHAKTARQKQFSSPKAAVEAMVDTLRANDDNALGTIFGPAGRDLISSGDNVADKRHREHFLKLYDEKSRLESVGDRKVLLFVGNEEWPLPFPIVRKGKSWFFNAKAGREEILDRRVGANELDVIQVCLAYVDAQREYAQRSLKRTGLAEYARKFMSESGKKDGLYWEAPVGEQPSPLGAFATAARAEGYGDTQPGAQAHPYHGYYYKILTAQGKNTPGGAYDYVVDGRMIGGFALVAYPARYDNSGIMTFVVNHNGTVYQKNLGMETEKIARDMKLFNPDKTWKKVE